MNENNVKPLFTEFMDDTMEINPNERSLAPLASLQTLQSKRKREDEEDSEDEEVNRNELVEGIMETEDTELKVTHEEEPEPIPAWMRYRPTKRFFTSPNSAFTQQSAFPSIAPPPSSISSSSHQTNPPVLPQPPSTSQATAMDIPNNSNPETNPNRNKRAKYLSNSTIEAAELLSYFHINKKD